MTELMALWKALEAAVASGVGALFVCGVALAYQTIKLRRLEARRELEDAKCHDELEKLWRAFHRLYGFSMTLRGKRTIPPIEDFIGELDDDTPPRP